MFLSFRVFSCFRIASSVLMALLVGCGSPSESNVKDYRLFFNTDDTDVLVESQRLVQDFNSNAGFIALTMVDSSNDANSIVEFRKGIEESEGKIGYGQSSFRAVTAPVTDNLRGKSIETKNYFSMNLEFDADFFKERMGKDSSDSERQRLQLLFFHEVGHGLTFNHENIPASVMYPYINQAQGVDFYGFFQKVRAFFED